LPDSKVNGAATKVVKASIKGGTDVSLYFDKSTGLLAKAERKSKQSGVDVIKGATFSNYKAYGNVTLPSTEAQLLGANKIADIKDIKYFFEEKIDDSLFNSPTK